jgi:hypothetical protein
MYGDLKEHVNTLIYVCLAKSCWKNSVFNLEGLPIPLSLPPTDHSLDRVYLRGSHSMPVLSPLLVQMPLTPTRFHALNPDTQNLLIAEQLLGLVCVMQPGVEHILVCPPAVAAQAELDPNALAEWQQSYGSTDFVSSVHAIAKVWQQLGIEDIEISQKPRTGVRPHPWSVVLVYEERELSGGATSVEEVPSLIAMLCLQLAGIVL